MYDTITKIEGNLYVETLLKAFSSENVSHWLNKPAEDVIRDMRAYINQAVANIYMLIDRPFQKPEARTVKVFDLSEDFRLERILEHIKLDTQSIDIVMATIDAYWSSFRRSSSNQYLYQITTPATIMREMLPSIIASNLRIQKWTRYIIQNPAINELSPLDISDTMTFRYVIEVVISNTDVIRIVTEGVTQYLKLRDQ